MAVDLFQEGEFTLHSGEKSWFKIECDALSDDELDVFARLVVERIGTFKAVYGIPRGGARFAEFLQRYLDPDGVIDLLIADDVYTTGGSMERAFREHEDHGEVAGVVIFNRSKNGSTPNWIMSIFRMFA